MARLLWLLPALVACKNESEIHVITDVGEGDGISISGWVCDYDRNTWLEGALVYTHVFTPEGVLAMTVQATTDAEGLWVLPDLYENSDYTVYIQSGSTILDMFDVHIGTESVVLDEPDCGGGDLKVAVISGDYDEFTVVLDALGISSYDEVNGQTGEELVQFLSDAEHMAVYDVIFFDGGHLEEDIFYDTDGSDTAGETTLVKDTLRAYVEAGGLVVASDWAYDVVEQTWPQRIDFLGDDRVPDEAQKGEPATVTATVADADLVDHLGAGSMTVLYDLDVWPPIEAVDDKVTVHVTGDVSWRQGDSSASLSGVPLLVSFRSSAGAVIFNTWRNVANADGDPMKAVKYLVQSSL